MRSLVAITLAFFLLGGAGALSAELAGLPANQWTVLHDGPPGVMAVHAKLEWMPDPGRGFLWPSLHYGNRYVSFEQHATTHYYSVPGTWEKQVTTYPEDLKTAYGNNIGVNYVWLPGPKRILLLHGGGNQQTRKTFSTWLLDPETGQWEAIVGSLHMGDKSPDFNPSACSEGGGYPIYGTLVYDAHNREAVLIGGCGTWGRVGKEPEPLDIGDWFYDEAAEVKRVRRVLAAEKPEVTEGRRWYPANCGTWTFSAESRQWTPIARPMGEQLPGRILPGAAYDSSEKKIVVFGGDNFCGPSNDTWIYDCVTREWCEAKPSVSPPHRAAQGMCYVADQNVVFMAGGFGPGWKPLADTWVYRTAENTWTCLAAELPVTAELSSAAYDPASRTVLYVPSVVPRYGKSEKTTVLGLRLDLATASTTPALPLAEGGLPYHCRVDKQWGAPLPEEWDAPENAGMAPEAGRKELASLPANTWVLRKPPMGSRARQWGSYVYDPRNHKAYAWGGGHYGYTGCEMSEYDVLRNRWRSMNDIVAYKVNWRRGDSNGGVPGPGFQGWRLMGNHARKSYGVDHKTDSVVTFHGDVYDIAENRFVTCIGVCPGDYGVGDQVCFEDTPDGIYAYHTKYGPAQVWLADVKAGRWKLVKKETDGGPRAHNEYATLCHDRKRNKFLYTVEHGEDREFWSFDIATRDWARIKPANTCPGLRGCPTYVDDLDAILWTWGTGGERGSKEPFVPRMTFYKIAENKFYTAPWKGPSFGSHGDLNNSPHYDPELKLVVRLAHHDREGNIPIGVMRLDPEILELTEVGGVE